jgi:hypothetical protein
MKTYRIFQVLFLAGICGVGGAGAQEIERAREAVPNWPAPPPWLSPASASGAKGSERTTGVRAQDILPSPEPFIAMTPCRVADTRGNGFGGAYGPPAIGANTTRTFVIVGQCGIPSAARSVSFNFTALDVTGAGDLRVFPAGSSVPLVSTLNYNANTPNIANAAVVPLGPVAGDITVQADATTINLIIDVNGYYGGPTGDGSNVFVGPFAGNATMGGDSNTGVGLFALHSLSMGVGNTAVGDGTMGSNDIGSNNTAIGRSALLANHGGSGNTAVGLATLPNNANGNSNTAVGYQALFSNVDGGTNVAVGGNALANIAASADNIAIGYGAAIALTAGAHNIHIGNPALSSESNTIRIGAGGTHTKFFVAGVRNVTTVQANAVPVVIDGAAQLGTLSSSARVKREIADIGEESSALLKLRPVSFFYRNDTVGYRQYGLIAEEVAEVMPDLVQYSEAGDPEMVRWHFLPPLLLNELQKQQKTIEQQQRTIGDQNAVIAGLEARLARIEARLPTEPVR